MNKETFIAVDKHYESLMLADDPDFSIINQAAESAGLPALHVSPLQGKLLQLLVQLAGARRVLEIGTLAGFSTAWLARGLPAGGTLISLELEPDRARLAEQNLSGWEFRPVIKILVGDGLQLIDEMILAGTEPFDLVFIDAEKERYAEYLEGSLKLSHPGTFIVADNVVRAGRILDLESDDPSVIGIHRFNHTLQQLPQLTATTIQTVGAKSHDGLTLIYVNPE